ncbi:MAG TPA: response regulator [Gemmatimonadaceae bacterium]|nr:response regulator [Gemmatimonadaceae bacterium]
MRTRILVVEDSATQAMALTSMLEEQNFSVVRVASGEEAIERLQDDAVNLVLSDIVMPGMSGYDLCRHIKADPYLATIPVVLLTSLTDPLDIVRGLECGADNYVTKPYDAEYLCLRIRHVIDRHRLRVNPKASLGVNVNFLGTSFAISSDKEQILDLFISTVEDVVRTNRELLETQRELASAQATLQEYAHGLSRTAQLSTEKYAALMHHASDAITVLDPGGRIVEVNQRATDLFGLPSNRVAGHLLADFTTAESADLLTLQLSQLTHRSGVSAELDIVHASGTVTACRLAASRSENLDGALVLAILHDVTAIRDATNRMQKSQAQLAQAQQIAAVGSWERDLATGVSDWSAETCRIFGIPESEGRHTRESFLAFVDAEDQVAVEQSVIMAMNRRTPIDIEFRIRRSDASTRTVHARAEAVSDASGKPVRLVGTVQDISDRRHLEEQLHQAQKMEAVGQLAGGVAHDFNNLLTVITSYCGMLLSDTPADDPRSVDIAEIGAAATRAAALTRQLLAFSRRQVLQARLVDVNVLTRQLETLLRRLVREDISIVTSLEAVGATVWADPGQLEQVIMNLVVNARDAMPDGGTITIGTATEQLSPELPSSPEIDAAAGRCVVIEVSDTGCGMSPAVQAKIFEPFFTTKAAGVGTGLGLATVYGIVRQSGGEIAVDSTPGAGTSFRIFLPRRDGAVAPLVDPPTSMRAVRGGGETVLVVEDDSAVRAVANRILRKEGYDVLEASNGREGLDICAGRKTPIHLVLTDMVMPEMSGVELGARIAASHPEVRLLFMSGYTRDKPAPDPMSEGVTSWLEKPFTPAELVAKVRAALDAPAAERARSASEDVGRHADGA